MGVYLVIFAFIIICSMINLEIEKEKLKLVYIVMSIFLLLFVIFRDNLGGTDYFVYKGYFENTPPLAELQKMDYHIEYEIGFKYLNSLIKSSTSNYYWLFGVIGLCTFPVLLISNYKYCKYPFFTMGYYMYKTFFYTNFIAMRQTIAVAIFIIAIKYIIEGNLKKYSISIILASLFHSSAVVLFFVYFVRNLKLYKKNIFYILSVGGVLFVFSDILVNILESVLSIFNADSSVLDKVDGITKTSGINLHVIEIVLLYMLLKKSYKIKCERDKIFLNIFVLYMILLLGFSGQVIFIRISMYFYIIIMIFMSKSIEGIESQKYRSVLVYMLLIVFLLGYVKYLNQFDNGGLIPYKSILFK